MISGLQVYRPGVGWLQANVEKLLLAAGDVLRVSIAVPYKGPEHEFTLYGSIGQRGIFGFDEILSAGASLPCPNSPEKFTTVTGSVDIEIVGAGFAGIGGISAGADYDLYVKVEEKPEVMAELDDVINIAGAPAMPDISSMFMMMLPLMMMGMVVPMFTEEGEMVEGGMLA